MIIELMQCGFEIDVKRFVGEVIFSCIFIRKMEELILGFGKKFFLVIYISQWFISILIKIK